MDKQLIKNILAVVITITLLFTLYYLYNCLFIKDNPNALPLALFLMLVSNVANLIRINLDKPKPKNYRRKKY